MAGDASIDSIWARLREWETNASSSAIYALIDKRCARAPDDPIALPRLLDALNATAVCVPRADLKHKPDVCPYLVRISTPEQPLRRSEEVIRRLADHLVAPVSVHGNYVAAFLQSDAPASTLAQGLARRLVQRDTQGRRRVVALFEPLRLALYLDATQDDARRESWLGDIAAWLTVNGGGQFLAWHRQQAPSPHAARLPYTPEDAMHQARIREIRRLWLALRRAGIEAPDRAEITLSNCLGEAEAQGLHDPEDRTLYVLNSLSFGAGWHAPAAVQACIGQAARNEQRLASALESLTEPEKRSMAQSGEADPIDSKGAFA